MDEEKMIADFKSAGSKLLLLDYDGTLVGFAPTPAEARPTVELINLLDKLASKTNLDLVLITGRSGKSISELLSNSRIRIIAEHGASVRVREQWINADSENTEWKAEISAIMHKYTAFCEGSFVEEKEFAVCWHYRKADPECSNIFTDKLIQELAWRLKKYNLRLIDGKKVVEVLPANINKGTAVSRLIHDKNYDCVICIGDDRNDEEMFNVLLPYAHCYTIKVGAGDTKAKSRIDDIQGVLSLLKKL